MMDEENKDLGSGSMDHQGHMDHSHCCGYCGMWGMHGHGHGHRLLRFFLGLLILFVVFWLGVKVGQFKGEYAGMGNYGQYGRMGGRYMMNPQPMMLWGTPGMMRSTTTPVK